MADGLSIAASVAGLVSLGLQVCSGITTYLDGLKCRAEELEYARQYEQSLKASIQAIEVISPQLPVHHHNSPAAITACMQLCKDKLEALDHLVAELCDENKNNPSLRDRAKASRKRLTYPFDRPTLSQLQMKVDQAIQSLQLALQILGLESSSSLGHTLRTIDSTSKKTAADIIATNADIAALADDMLTLRNEGPCIRAAIENIGPSLLDLGKTATQTVQGIQVVREDTNLAAKMLSTEMQLMRNQLATFQNENAVAQRATTQLLQVVQQNQGRIIGQMISRPSYLQEISEACLDAGPSARGPEHAHRTRMSVLTTTARDRESSNSMLPMSYARRCTCQSRQRLQRKQVVCSGFLLYQDNIYFEKHFPTCELWQATKATERKWGLRQVGIGWIAQKAIEITFSSKSGAGGASFGPSFTYYPTVDENVAPAFQILNVMVGGREAQQTCLHYWKCFFNKGFQSLEKLFREGRASPNDMNDRNQTLIYRIIDLVWWFLEPDLDFEDPDEFMRILFGFLKDIRSLDIPSHIYDIDGRSPIAKLSLNFQSFAEAGNIIFDRAAGIPSVATSEIPFGDYDGYELLIRSIIIQEESQLIAEAYGCGQLSQAVLADDIKQVERLLQKDHASLMEVNCWGQTPLHLSVTHPAILRSLLQYCNPSQLNKPDCNGYTAFHYALLISPDICKSLWVDPRCRHCHCAAPLKLLITAGCAVDIGSLKISEDFDITQRCLRHLIRGLKKRREKLKILALDHLSNSDIVALNLRNGCVLDAQAAIVLELLEANGVYVPHSLKLTQQQKAGTSNGSVGVSVYHIIINVDDADRFWAHDFRDIDEFNGKFDEVEGDGLPPIVTRQNDNIIIWLFNHGANLFTELDPSDGSANGRALCMRIAHFVYQRHGNNWAKFRRIRGRVCDFSPIHAIVLPVDIFDNCECSCSKQGCTPFILMLKAFNSPHEVETRKSNIFLVEKFLEYIERFRYKFTKKEYKEAVRYFTFTALDMVHTCHHKVSWRHTFTCSATIEMCEENMHIRDEQADMIQRLEKILFDLDAELDTMMEDDEEFDIGTFLTDHWLERVEQELEVISGSELPEDFRRDTEELGVVWSDAAEETELDLRGYGTDQLQYYLDAIDRAAQL